MTRDPMPTPHRRGGRAARAGDRSTPAPQPPFAQPLRTWTPVRGVSDDELERIHHASLTVLRDTGMDVLCPSARSTLVAAGAEQGDADRIRFDPDLVIELVAQAPPAFEMRARNPAHDLTFGTGRVAFSAVASAPNVSGLGHDRHPGTAADFRDLVRLTQRLSVLHLHGGYPVEPIDWHPGVRHLLATDVLLRCSDKVLHTYSLGRQRTLDTLEMVRLARGLTDDELVAQPSIYTVVNTSSPLRLDVPMAEGIQELSSRGQPIVVTPFTLAGAMAPVTLAGALVQQNAEALATIALTQAVRPGAPVIYGGFTSNVDMQSGAPAFGTPEFVNAALIGGQLARRYGLPYRSSAVNAANSLDVQSSYESMFSLWGAVLGGADLVVHAAGWMEGGLCASYEKMVLDAEVLEMLATALTPITVDDASLAVDAIAAVGPGGHFFGTDHTRARYRSAFRQPRVSDWRNFEAWDASGRPTAVDRATEIARDLLAPDIDPDIDPDRSDALAEFVDRRVAEGGVDTPF